MNIQKHLIMCMFIWKMYCRSDIMVGGNVMEIFCFLIGAFFELCWIILSCFLNLMGVMFIELFKALGNLALDNMFITVPILIFIGIVIIAKIYGAVSRTVGYSKTAPARQSCVPVNYNRVACTNYDYDDDDYYDDEDDDEQEDSFMSNVYRSEVGLFGDEVFYDKNGTKIGHAESGLFGDKVYYDRNGTKVMRGEVGLLGDTTYYDTSYNKVGRSEVGLLGDRKIYDKSGNFVGRAETGLLGDKKYTKK